MRVTLGRIVHYYDTEICHAAFVTAVEVDDTQDCKPTGKITLFVPDRMQHGGAASIAFVEHVEYGGSPEGDNPGARWHWPVECAP